MAYSADDEAILGLKIVHGTVDLGDVTDFSIAINITRVPFYSVRTGKRVKVKEVTTSVEIVFTFNSRNILDATVRDLWAGAAGGEMSFEATTGALVITMPNFESENPGLILNFPSAALSGNGFAGNPGEEPASFAFQASALLEGDAESLGTIGNTTVTP